MFFISTLSSTWQKRAHRGTNAIVAEWVTNSCYKNPSPPHIYKHFIFIAESIHEVMSKYSKQKLQVHTIWYLLRKQLNKKVKGYNYRKKIIYNYKIVIIEFYRMVGLFVLLSFTFEITFLKKLFYLLLIDQDLLFIVLLIKA